MAAKNCALTQQNCLPLNPNPLLRDSHKYRPLNQMQALAFVSSGQWTKLLIKHAAICIAHCSATGIPMIVVKG